MDIDAAVSHNVVMLLRRALASGFRAARANVRPGLVLWLLAALVVSAYYVPGGARRALDQLAAFKQHWGYPFAMASTSLWGAVVPTLFLRMFHKGHRVSLKDFVFLAGFWAAKGAEVNLLYDCLARWIGAEASVRNIVLKSLADQLIYGPLWAVPTLALAYLWRDQNFSFVATARAVDRHFYETTALPMLLANWGVWIPTVAAIYALPVGLQLPMQNLALCLWSLMLTFMTGQRSLSPQLNS